MNIGFSIDQHDKDGDKFDDCLLLHFNDTFLLRLSDVKELDEVIKELQDIRTELVDNYGL
jgi:hypothetical protein